VSIPASGISREARLARLINDSAAMFASEGEESRCGNESANPLARSESVKIFAGILLFFFLFHPKNYYKLSLTQLANVTFRNTFDNLKS